MTPMGCLCSIMILITIITIFAIIALISTSTIISSLTSTLLIILAIIILITSDSTIIILASSTWLRACGAQGIWAKKQESCIGKGDSVMYNMRCRAGHAGNRQAMLPLPTSFSEAQGRYAGQLPGTNLRQETSGLHQSPIALAKGPWPWMYPPQQWPPA